MAQALRAARPALVASRHAPAAPSTLGALRLWQQYTPRDAARPALSVARLGDGRLRADVRHSHTTAAKTPRQKSGKAKRERSEGPEPVKMGKDMKQSKSDAGVVQWDKNQLRFRSKDGEWDPSFALSSLWLRDSCPCHHCVDPDSGQKNFSTTDLPTHPEIENAILNPDRSLQIVWAADPPSGGASHTTVFPAHEVAAWQTEPQWQRGRYGINSPERIPWDKAAYEALLADGRCRVSYDDWMNNDAAFWDAFTDLHQTGLIFVTGVPSGEEEVKRIASRIGPLQHTFYGWTWDVKSKPRAENVAYTSKFLGLHQDLMYHEPIPQLQILHCLNNSCEGGESLFSSGIRAAYELKLTDPDNYNRLTKLKSWFGYRKGENHHFATRNTIVKDNNGLPFETRWAPPFQANFRIGTHARTHRALHEWKEAATKFQQLVESERSMVEMKLREGECVIFDNRRILHGRRQFATGGEGDRWLKGTYISPHDYQAAVTRLQEYMQSAGMVLPPAWVEWREEVYVRESLALREGSAEMPGTVEDVEVPDLIPTQASKPPASEEAKE